MRISPETVDRVRAATDIVALIGEHVRLVKSGKAFKGLCPFHTEKTPSFMVNAERQTFHCFGCGQGGNAITFLMEYAKMSFPEAVRYLGERSGIEVTAAAGDAGRDQEAARLHEALAFAAEAYRERFDHPAQGKPARDYLAGRGIDPGLAAEFGLGFAPAGWHFITEQARNRFTPEVLLKAGLTIARETGGAYDRFRNRLMIPVSNHLGKVVGFGGRAIDNEEPKYLNSPETPVYQKGQILFGLAQARDAIHKEDQALVVEGYLDHLRVFGAGFRNVVAVAGTAFTPNQAGLLKRYAARTIFVFDGDTAGVTASWRAAAPSVAAGLDVRLALLPAGHDPDSLIRDEGPDAFRRVISGALDLVDFAAVRVAAERGREEALKRLVEVIRECPDPIRRRLLVQNAAERLRFDEGTLVRAVESGKSVSVAAGVKGRPASPAAPARPADPVERGLIALVLGEPELLEAVDALDEDDFQDPPCREVYGLLKLDPARETWADRLMEEDPASPLARFVSQLKVDPAGGGLKSALDHVRKLKERRLNARMALLNRELLAAESAGDGTRSHSILIEINNLVLEKKNLAKSTLTGAKSDHD